MTDNMIFENKSIKHLIVLFSFPTIFSLILESLVSMIDTVFAGHLGAISTSALSAIGLLAPILQILLAGQLIFGVSTSIVVSKRIGEKNKEEIHKTFKVGFLGCAFFSILISLVIFIFQDNLLNIFGAKGEILALAKEYLKFIVVANVFNSIGYMLVNLIRVFGYPKMEIIIGITSTISNITLNFFCTFILGLGIKGIALATLISSVIYMSFGITFLIKKKLWFDNINIDLKAGKELLLSIMRIGFVQFWMQALTSISVFVINMMLVKFSNVTYVGAWAICSNINMMILLPLIGLTQGSQSVLAYFYGKQDKRNEFEVKQNIIKYSIIYSIIITILTFVLASSVLSVFTTDQSLIDIGVPIIRIAVLGFPFMGIIYTLITFMQVLGQEQQASKLEIIRQICILIPLVIIIPYIIIIGNFSFIKPEVAMFFAIPISNIIILIIYLKKAKELFRADAF